MPMTDNEAGKIEGYARFGLKAMGELIRMESRLNASRFVALFAEVDGIKRRFEEIERKIDALSRAIAELLASERRRK